MKKLMILLLLIPMVAVAQKTQKFSVSGTAYDSVKDEPAAFATVLLVSESNVAVASTYSDNNGKFKLDAPKGDYALKVNYVGYAPYSRDITLSEDLEMGEITIEENIAVEAVTVKGQLVTSDIDKTSYNTDQDPEAAALTALEMIRKVPMLSVDGDENIRLRGEQNFKILVNGKSSSVMSNNYKEVLRSMPASTIKRIEVITNPPAKYDAEGVGGIINIVTTKRAPEGFSGSVYAGYGTLGDWNAGAYLAASKGKFNMSASLSTGEFKRPDQQNSGTIINNYSDALYRQDMLIKDKSEGNHNGINLEMSYEFDTLNLLSFSANGHLGSYNSTSFTTADVFTKNGIQSAEYFGEGYNEGSWGSVGLSLDYQRTFAGKPNRLLTASYKVDYNPNNGGYATMQDTVFSSVGVGILPYERRADNKAWGMEHALQIDYFDKITDNHQVEAGLKYTLRPSVSNSLNESLVNGIWVEDLLLKNDLDYMQHIGSMYAAYQYSLKKFSVKAGGRAEYTVNDGSFISQEITPMSSHYFNFIPYLTLGFKPTDFESIRLGYTQRISRPGISQLNPFVDDNGAMIKTGNPDLVPEISHTFDFAYGVFTPMFNINTSLTARVTNNSIQTITTAVGENLVARPENIGKNQSYIASIGGGVRLFGGKLSVNVNGSGGYVKVEANDGSGLENDGWQYNLFGQLSANCWTDGTISAYGGGGANMVSLQSNDMKYFFSGVSVSQNFLNKRLNINLSAQSPFNKYTEYSMSMSDPTMSMDMVQRSLTRSLKLTATWRFGQQTSGVKRTRRSIENTDAYIDASKTQGTSM